MFFKKVQVTLKKPPIYLKEIDIEISQEGNYLFNFFHGLDDRSYFKDSEKIRGFIKVNYIKLSDNIYQIDVIVKNHQCLLYLTLMLIKYTSKYTDLYIYTLLIFFVRMRGV